MSIKPKIIVKLINLIRSCLRTYKDGLDVLVLVTKQLRQSVIIRRIHIIDQRGSTQEDVLYRFLFVLFQKLFEAINKVVDFADSAVFKGDVSVLVRDDSEVFDYL